MNKKIISLLLVTLSLSSIFVGCKKDNIVSNNNKIKNEISTNKNEDDKTEKLEENKEKTTFPIIIKNFDGKNLEIKEKPKKIASLILGTDEILLNLVEDETVAGISGKSAENELASNVAEKAKKFPKVENSIEILLETNPDLVIGSSWVKKEFLKHLEDSGIQYYGYKTPSTIEEQKEIIENISKAVGEQGKGTEIIDNLNKRLKYIEDKVKDIDEKDKVRVMAYNMNGTSNGKGTIFDDIVKKVGAINITSSEAGLEKWAKISKEKIIEMNPEAIILLAWAKDDINEFDNFVKQLKEDESLKEVDAIKNNRVYVASNKYMTTVSHHIIEGIEFTAKSLYPDLFK